MAVVCKKLTSEQAEAVKSSWKLVEPNKKSHGVTLFTHIFTIAPQAYNLFTFLDGVSVSELAHSPKLVKHALGVMDAVGAAVEHADEMEDIHRKLYSLGQRHIPRGVKPEHYLVVGQALVKTLQDGFGNDFTPILKEAWQDFYGIITCLMQNGPNSIKWQ